MALCLSVVALRVGPPHRIFSTLLGQGCVLQSEYRFVTTQLRRHAPSTYSRPLRGEAVGVG
jgi:hypothetical protein